jgi:uncharacterized repeat protein (TIGR03803 family)
MRTNIGISSRCSFLAGIASVIVATAFSVAAESKEVVLYTFKGGSDGATPISSLIEDNSGDIFGTTVAGGGSVDCPTKSQGCGTVFEIAPDGSETVLHAFAVGAGDGANPFAGVVADASGNLYGTTEVGGDTSACHPIGCGTVFKLTPSGSEKILYAFKGGSDGAFPASAVILDKKGNLYGTTEDGGDSGTCNGGGCGVVFKLKPDGKETILHVFEGGDDGAVVTAGLISDGKGNLYGTTLLGGGSADGGTVFKIADDGTESVIYAFQGGADGAQPQAGLTIDKAGNFYGTTVNGGTAGWGTVFEISAGGTKSVLYSFQRGNDGASPYGSLVLDKSGNLYGTTTYGGGSGCNGNGCGTVFKLTPGGTETILSRLGTHHGAAPMAGLLGRKDLLYGTTYAGGINRNGVVFSVKQ